MKTKSFFHWVLMAALTLGLSINLVACSDDDDDKDDRTPEEKAADPYDKQTDAAHALYALLSQVSVIENNELPDNWKTATWEPSCGQVINASQPYVRTVTVNNIKEAATRYNSLTSKSIGATTQTDTWEQSELGSITYTALNQSDCFATIDFNIKQLPHLQQLRLVPVSAIGENGSFSGEPYYHFGDVVKYAKDNTYWICVRPAYSPNGKEDTHWMSFQLDESNKLVLQKSGCLKQTVPTKLGKELTKMQYLAQLMAILARPNQSNSMGTQKSFKDTFGEQPFEGTTGLGGLLQNAMPNDSLVRLALLWKQENIWDKVKPSGMTVEEFKKRFTQAVSFFYNGYTTSGKNLKLWKVTYNDPDKFFRGDPQYSTPSENMQNTPFDVDRNYTVNGTGDNSFPNMGDGFIVRYATGKQLSTNWFFDPDPTKHIDGVEDVFRYDNKTEITNNDENTWDKSDYVGDSYYHTGDVYVDEKGSKWIVWRMAGSEDEKSPFTELVSFEGLENSNDKNYFTNIPNRTQVLRAIPQLWLLIHNAQQNMYSDKLFNNSNGGINTAARNIYSYAEVDIRLLAQQVKKSTEDARAETMLFSVPYYDENSKKQKLIRVIEESANEKKDVKLWLWEHYPSVPSANELWQKNFSDNYIFLQDVANQDMVNKYAEDFYARQPLITKSDMGEDVPGETRQPRKSTDDVAINVSYYIYLTTSWKNALYHTDMWNAPLLCFRYTAIYDRGFNDRASTTIDGKKLKKVHLVNIVSDDDDDWDPENKYEMTTTHLNTIWVGFSKMFLEGSDSFFLDGKPTNIITWKKAWE